MEPRIIYCKPKVEYAASILCGSFRPDVTQSLPKIPEAAARTTLRSFTPPDVEVMEAPSINSRQPPDGHEFPDYQEAPIISKPIMSDKVPPRTYTSRNDQPSPNNVRNMIAIFSTSTSEDNIPDGESNDGLNKKGLSKSVMNINTIQSSFSNYNSTPTSTPNNHNYANNRNSLDLSNSTHCVLPEKKTELTPTPRLHTRSQSLIDISDEKSKPATDRWSLLVEQRRKGLSKLKGLIIPEHSDTVETVPVVDLPEIKSTTAPVPLAEIKSLANIQIPNHNRNCSTPSVTPSIWNTEISTAIPKYSPAFKRKTLQIYGSKSVDEKSSCTIKSDSIEKSLPKPQKQAFTSQADDECRLPVTLSLNDAPKSLESITSPTRSDCSFEYISSSPELKNISTKFEPRKACNRVKEDTGKSEDESDNDSAVSSSQSSYISRNSPPVSPNHLQSHFPAARPCNILENEPLDRSRNKYELTGSELQGTDSLNRRLLKPQSVEAINRKNILASAKCRSGRDLKVGSPLIQRKFDENNVEPTEMKPHDAIVPDKINNVFVELETVEVETVKVVEEIKNDVPIKEEIRKEPKKIISESKSFDKTPSIPTETNGLSIRTTITKENINDRETKRNVLNCNKILPRNTYNRTASVTDLRKNFEKNPAPSTKLPSITTSSTKANPRLSLNITATPSHSALPVPAKRNSLPILPQATNKALSNSDTKKIIDDTLHNLEESFNKDDLNVIVLYPEIPGGSIGITLAGGTDYETKEITVHKVRNGSAAFRDGRLQKGDRILSINGKSMIGVTHAESIAILKVPVSEVVIVACAGKDLPTPSLTPSSRHSSMFDLSAPSPSKDVPVPTTPTKKREDIVVTLLKDSAGLGFSMEGGKDSPQGDVPLVIKKLFTGGIADKSGKLQVGDELVDINGVDVTAMLRIDVWTLMKKLPLGQVILKVRR